MYKLLIQNENQEQIHNLVFSSVAEADAFAPSILQQGDTYTIVEDTVDMGVMVELSQEQKDSIAAKAYLDSTDWYIIRFQETGVAIPAEITAARATARTKVL